VSLYELSAVQVQSEIERQAEERDDAIHKAAVVALRAATVFSSLALDLTPQEQKQAITDGHEVLRQFDSQQERLDPVMKHYLTAEEQGLLARSVQEIRRAWKEIQEEITLNERDEVLFHLVAITRHADVVRKLLLNADEAARRDAKSAADARELRAAQAKWTILLSLFAGMAGVLAVGWLVLHFGVHIIQWVERNGKFRVRRINHNDIFNPLFRNKIQNFLDNVPVRVNQAKPVPVCDVLAYQ